MAGPFEPVVQQDIASERLVQTTLPKSAVEAGAGVIDAVSRGAAAAIDLNTKQVTKEKREALNKQFDAVGEALAATRGAPEDVARLEAAAASGDPFFRQALEEFRTIQSATQQGRLPSDAATIRMRAILKKATAASPEFADELRTAARQHLGFAPVAETFRRQLREPRAGGKSESQKQLEKYNAAIEEVMRVNPGIDQDTATQIVNTRIRTKSAADLAQAELQLGAYNSGKSVALMNEKGSEITIDVMGMINQQLQGNNGVFDVQAAKTSANALVSRMEVEVLSGVTDPKISGDLRKQVGDLRQTLNRMIDDASVGKRAGKLTEAMINMTKQQAMVDYPMLRSYMALRNGTDSFFTAVDTAAKFANNPEIMNSLGIGAGDRLMQQIALGTPMPNVVMQSGLRFENGEPPVSPGDQRVRGVYAKGKMEDENTPSEERVRTLNQLTTESGEFTAVTALDSAEMISRAVGDSRFAQATAQLIATNLEGSASRAVKAATGVPGASVEMRGGELVVVGMPPAFETIGGQQDAVTELTQAVEQFNRVNGINTKYVRAGVTTEFDFQSQVEETAEQAAPSTFNTDITDQASAAGFAPTEDGIYVDSAGNRVEVRGGRVFTTGE